MRLSVVFRPKPILPFIKLGWWSAHPLLRSLHPPSTVAGRFVHKRFAGRCTRVTVYVGKTVASLPNKLHEKSRAKWRATVSFVDSTVACRRSRAPSTQVVRLGCILPPLALFSLPPLAHFSFVNLRRALAAWQTPWKTLFAPSNMQLVYFSL